jgi:CRISPR/Cas system CSM-associated protein Csm3 (group 7 of RAMP superfamily)
MPAKSKAQRKAAAIALAAAKGRIPVRSLKGPARSMYESMNTRELEEYASGSEARKPEHVKRKQSRRKTSLKHKNRRR